ncbi:MAG: hypothetical protein JWQ63_3511 [Mucilaginibacter sp.]|nr:hypothetical protein [Mucilaginibacter sp.]
MVLNNILCSNDIDWGAVASIATCIYTVVAIIGVIYVVRSFQEQTRINESQAEINRHQLELSEQQKSLNTIAMQGYIRSVRPLFARSDNEPDDRIEFKLKNAISRKINVWILDKNEKVVEHFVKDKTGIPDLYSFSVIKRIAHPIVNSKKIFLLIKYLDEDERHYYQKVYNNNDFGITWPKLLLEDKSLTQILNDPDR